jgi:cytochrome oxidase Cu insertion factor (SCO1/SenC/PrrC family)
VSREGGIARRRVVARYAGLVAVGAVLLVAASAFAGCGSSASPTATTSTSVTPTTSSESAPDFSATTLDGLDVSLSQYRGKPLVLAFMASW